MMKLINKSILTLVLVFILSFSDMITAMANSKTPTPSNSQDITSPVTQGYAGLGLTSPVDASAPLLDMPQITQTTYKKEFKWTSTVTMQGIFSKQSLYFSVPKYWDSKYVFAEIQYDVSQLIKDVPASLTFSVNSIPVSSCKLEYNQGKTQTTYVKIPADILKEGYNVFDIAGYVELYDSKGCVDNNSVANWVNINTNSYICVGYEAKAHNRQIAYYPYPFISTMQPQAEKTKIFVSDAMENAEISAAMCIMAGLSSFTESENQMTLGTLRDINKTGPTEKIVVSKTQNLSSDLLAFVDNTTELDNKAMVKFVEDTKGNPLLLIVSNSDECLMEAAYMLMDDDRVSQETTTAYVKAGSAQLVKQGKSLNPLVAGTYTLKDITQESMAFVGPFHQRKDLTLPFSSDYVLGEGSKATIKFRYSENLDFDRSLMTVYWAGVPVASKKLKKENASSDELTFSFPTDVREVSGNSISVAFDLEIKDLICTPKLDKMPWAYISSDSTFYLPIGISNSFSFDNKPSPIQSNGKFSNVLIVLSDTPTLAEINVLGQIMSMYGENIGPYGDLKTIRASEFSEGDANYNIITVGSYSNNAFIQQINDKLSFKYALSGDSFESNDQLILSDQYASKVAILQLIRSPFSNNKAVLAVCGTNDTNLAYVEKLVQVKKKRWDLKKDCVIIDHNLKVKTYKFIDGSLKTDKPNIKQFINENKQSLIFTVVSTSAMLILLLAVIIILIRIKTYGKK